MNSSTNGRVILVTGSTDGIGKATALDLARRGEKVLLHGRNSDKGQVVLDEIKRSTGNDGLEFFKADLSSQRQVRRLASDIKGSHNKLDVLINNAGTYLPERRLTEDVMEMTFAVNYLAPFLLTHELLDVLEKSEPSRIINVASIAHWNAKLDWNNLHGEKWYDGFQAYALSKLCIILFTYALSRRLRGANVTVNCLHPGVIKTKLLYAGFGNYPGATPEKGARTPVYLATSPEVEGISGKYFENCKPGRSSPVSYDETMQERLWQVSKRLAKIV